MNKIIIAILVVGVAAVALYFAFGRNGGEITDNGEMEMVEQALQEDGARKVYGSCNAIATASNCIDYVGSMWADFDSAELNCEGAGAFSKNACPYADFGGCQIASGTVMETIAWVYEEGPGGYDAESVPYARAACNQTPTSNWVMPDDLI